MHFRKRRNTGKPQYRTSFSDWRHPQVDRGSSKHSNYSVVKAAQSASRQIKEFMHSSSNG